MTEHGGEEGQTWVPEACTLPTTQQPLRVQELDRLLATAVRVPGDGGGADGGRGRLTLRLDLDQAAAAADLAVRESACCSFFRFTLSIGSGGALFEIAVDDGHEDVLQALASRLDRVAADGVPR